MNNPFHICDLVQFFNFHEFFPVILFFQFASRFRDKLWMMIHEIKNEVILSVYLIIGNKFIVVINELLY